MTNHIKVWIKLIALVLTLSMSSSLPYPKALKATWTEEQVSDYTVANARWFNSEIDTYLDTGRYVSIAFDGYGIPVISYYDATLRDLRFAYYLLSGTGGNCGENNDWMCVDVDAGTNVGQYNSMDVISTYKAIAYHDSQNGDLKIARNSGGYANFYTRVIERGTISTSTGQYTSIVLNSEAEPYISYYYNNTSGVDALKVAYRVDSGGNCGYGLELGKWQCSTITTGEGVGQYTSLALDASENKHIAYYDAVNGDLWYATNSASANCGPDKNWACYPISVDNDVGKSASMYVDAQYNFHIAYYDETNGKLMYAKKVNDSSGNCGVLRSAQCDEIDDMRSKYNTHNKGIAIVQDAAGYPIIAYQSQYGDLNIARPLAALGLPAGYGNCGPVVSLFFTWQCTTIDRYVYFANAHHGDYIDIAVNSAGLANIAYYEFITESGGNLGISQQRLEVFTPYIVRID